MNFSQFSRLRLFLILFILIGGKVEAQSDTLAVDNSVIKIGIKESPPFIIINDDGIEGISVAFWELMNDDLGYNFEYKVYEDVGSLLNAVENAEVDFSINPITVTDHRMKIFDFTQPYYITETSYVKKNQSQILALLSNIVSWKFFSAVIILLSVIFVFGLLVWIFERKYNADEFGDNLKGIAQGFWWSAVTMTTVGYGDKAPKSTGGRVIGFIWMFTAIVMISGLTASIASSLTVQSINENVSSVQDLQKFKVITIKNSSSDKYLEINNVRRNTVTDIKEGLSLINEEKKDVFVYDKPILKYYIRENNWGGDLLISDKGLKTDYYSFSFPKESSLLPAIDLTLVSKLKSAEYARIVDKYQ